MTMATRTMTLTLDEDDYDAIQKEIADRQVLSRVLYPDEPTVMPDGDSCLVGAIFAECCRDLEEYRALFGSDLA
jgi:hypothetical protein